MVEPEEKKSTYAEFDDQRQMTGELMQRTVRQLKQIANEFQSERQKPERLPTVKTDIVEWLLAPQRIEWVRQFLAAGKATRAPAPFTPSAFEEAKNMAAEMGMSRSTSIRQLLRHGGDADATDEGADAASTEDSGRAESFPVLFEMRHAGVSESGGKDVDVAERSPLTSLRFGEEIPGRVSGVSLHDGLRVDVGAVVDALVPLAFDAKDEAQVPELGSKVTVRLSQIHVGADAARRRFPIVAELTSPSNVGDRGTSDDASSRVNSSSAGGGALWIDPGDDVEALHALRADGIVAPGVRAAVSHGHHADVRADLSHFDGNEYTTEARRLLLEASAMPVRPPPHEALSVDTSGRVQRLEVAPMPGAVTEAPSKSAAAAWQEFAAEELRLLGAEQSCRIRLAADLEAVERELNGGLRPSKPVALLGLTLLDDGRRCILPRVEGDRLNFEFFEPEGEGGFKAWAEYEIARFRQCWGGSGSEEYQAERKKLTALFACKDVKHARVASLAEEQELAKLAQHSQSGSSDVVAENFHWTDNTQELAWQLQEKITAFAKEAGIYDDQDA